MKKSTFGLIALAALLLVPRILLGSSDVSDEREWNFKVFLDDSEIGYHRFSLSGDAAESHVTSEADFRVKFLFVTAYRYRHSNSETWQGDCLQRIESQTNANGEKVSVSGALGPDGFQFKGSEGDAPGSDCVKTFAYWDPAFLNEGELLNSQTGEMLAVKVESLPSESLVVDGAPVLAQKYRLSAKGMELLLWYSEDREWLGLQSTTKGGRKLRYVLG